MENKYKLLTALIIIIVLLLTTGCRIAEERRKPAEDRERIQKPADIPDDLEQIEKIEHFATINGYKAEDGKFFFSGVRANQWKFYALDLQTKEVREKHREVGISDVFIPLEDKNAVFVDLDGRLFYRREGKDEKIDDQIFGEYSPNLIMSPD